MAQRVRGNLRTRLPATLRLVCVAAAVCGRCLAGDDVPAEPVEPAAIAQPDARIAELIQQLGAPEYATRERAQAELQRLRLDAFDALNEAQFHDDIEIAMSARYLVLSMQVNWASDDDAPEVKQQLRGYGDRPENERRALIDQLALLGPAPALRPLCRLARYEASERLSKHAALRALGLAVPADAAGRQELAQTLQARMGKSKRVAADWLRTYALLLRGEAAAVARWQELVDREQSRLVDTPEQTSREITRDLLKWFADQLAQRNRTEEALAVMRKMTSLLNSTPQEVLDAVDWFRERESWSIVVDIASQFPETFRRSPQLLYRLAETYSHLDDRQKAAETAQLALNATADNADRHLELAGILEHDGLFESAEQEYRHVAAMLESNPMHALLARYYLAELLHARHQDQAAGNLLQEIVEAVESSEEVRATLENDLGKDLGSTRSRLYFFWAEHEVRQGNPARQRELLLEGYRHDPRDADLLIAMYRVPEADETWERETRTRINTAADKYRHQITELQERLKEVRQADDRALILGQLALMNNQLAWLVANTDGNADEAIKCSLESLRLLENRSGFLDTLGRCYYAKGDFANAVKYQSRAVAQEPHSPTMVAQLELFQKALREQEAAQGPGEAAPPK
ncbi:MAG: hypothetical protein GXY58_14205 [Planctomycetaceae bacterium]|nr:hypothetical protein [Planctomycetaceae bacterium]